MYICMFKQATTRIYHKYICLCIFSSFLSASLSLSLSIYHSLSHFLFFPFSISVYVYICERLYV